MKDIYIIKTVSIDDLVFKNLPKLLYKEDSQRFLLGHEPVETNLENCYILLKNDKPVGRFAIYTNPSLNYKGKNAATIGSYECEEIQESANHILSFAKEKAKSLDFEFLIGPMEGSTWNSYRFSVSNQTPNFFMEPYHNTYYNQQFTNFGFTTIADYFSDIDTSLNYDDELLNNFQENLEKQGGKLRNINLDDAENELLKIGEFSIESFSKNFLFSSITPEEFANKNLKIKQVINPNFVWIIENKDYEIEAFMFSIPDYFCKTSKRIIAKSVVRKYDSVFKGAGVFLGGIMNREAKKAGFTEGIHALVISYNDSKKLSRHYSGENFKNYKLYGLDI